MISRCFKTKQRLFLIAQLTLSVEMLCSTTIYDLSSRRRAQASGILEPTPWATEHSPACSRSPLAAERWVTRKKETEPRARRVGGSLSRRRVLTRRQKAMAQHISHGFCHPSFRVPLFTYITPGSGLRVSRRSLATPSQAVACATPPGATFYRPDGLKIPRAYARLYLLLTIPNSLFTPQCVSLRDSN